jgi:5-oxoprolinase (ATP-hydrolysing)
MAWLAFTAPLSCCSVNIKERLDFSCALFGPDGGLVANAPHLPVHLGAMSEAVRFQVRGGGGGCQANTLLMVAMV